MQALFTYSGPPGSSGTSQRYVAVVLPLFYKMMLLFGYSSASHYMILQSIKRSKTDMRLILLTWTVLNPFVCFPHCFINKFTNNAQQYEAQENPHCDE